MKKLKGYSNAVIHLFPEFQFDNNFFQGITITSSKRLLTLCIVQFGDVKSRRKFFEDYARDNDFDALVPNNWYIQPREKMKLVKVFIKSSPLSSLSLTFNYRMLMQLLNTIKAVYLEHWWRYFQKLDLLNLNSQVC